MPRGGTGKPEYALDRKGHSYMDTTNTANSFYQFDLRKYRVAPTHYALMHDQNSSYQVRTWSLQGSNDGKDWTDVSRHKDDTSLKGTYGKHTFKVSGGEPGGYRSASVSTRK